MSDQWRCARATFFRKKFSPRVLDTSSSLLSSVSRILAGDAMEMLVYAHTNFSWRCGSPQYGRLICWLPRKFGCNGRPEWFLSMVWHWVRRKLWFGRRWALWASVLHRLSFRQQSQPWTCQVWFLRRYSRKLYSHSWFHSKGEEGHLPGEIGTTRHPKFW